MCQNLRPNENLFTNYNYLSEVTVANFQNNGKNLNFVC